MCLNSIAFLNIMPEIFRISQDEFNMKVEGSMWENYVFIGKCFPKLAIHSIYSARRYMYNDRQLVYTIVEIIWQPDLNDPQKKAPLRKYQRPPWPLYFLKAYEKCRFKFMFWKELRRPGAARGQKIFFSKKCWIFKFRKLIRGPYGTLKSPSNLIFEKITSEMFFEENCFLAPGGPRAA